MSDAPTRIEGPVRVTFTVEEATALRNPEVLSRGDWIFSVRCLGFEQWRNEKAVHIGQGKTKAVEGSMSFDVPAETSKIEVTLVAAERDLLSDDDVVEGSTQLYRTMGFHNGQSFSIEAHDESAHVKLTLSAQAEPIEA